jgi:selenocysteine lyase/cysteine desulfurase
MDLSPTASKLDTSLIWFAALAEQASLGLFQRFGIKAILERNAALSRRLLEALGARGAKVRLRVVASMRAGRIRLAVHFYNLEEDIDRVAALLAEV